MGFYEDRQKKTPEGACSSCAIIIICEQFTPCGPLDFASIIQRERRSNGLDR